MMVASPASSSQPPVVSLRARAKEPTEAKPDAEPGQGQADGGQHQAKALGSCLGRSTLYDQNGSSGTGDLDPGPDGRQIRPFGLP